MTVQEELTIIEQAKTNIQAFDKIYSIYINQIYLYIFQRVGNREIAEDITSEVFFSAVESIKNFDTEKNCRFGSWLYKVAHNKITDHWRKAKKRNHKDATDLQIEGNDSAEDLANLTQRQTEIRETLYEMKIRDQAIITYKFFTDLEIHEIAEAIGEKPKNVSVILHRALNRFRKIFQKKFPQSEIF